MALERATRRLPLRELLSETEKKSRDLHTHVGGTYMTKVADLIDLSRTTRRKSHFPTLLAIQNSLQEVLTLSGEVDDMIGLLEQRLEEIRDHGKRERLNRG